MCVLVRCNLVVCPFEYCRWIQSATCAGAQVPYRRVVMPVLHNERASACARPCISPASALHNTTWHRGHGHGAAASGTYSPGCVQGEDELTCKGKKREIQCE